MKFSFFLKKNPEKRPDKETIKSGEEFLEEIQKKNY
jgi:hypothetical protein